MEIEPFPDPGARDHIRQVIQAAVDVAPAGGALNRLTDLVVQPQYQKRRDEWGRSLGAKLAELLRRVEDLEGSARQVGTVRQMQDNDTLITSILAATEIAGRTHWEENLEALRNACLHVATEVDVDEQYALIFIRLVGDLTPLHLKVLTYLADPIGYFEAHQLERKPYTMASPLQALSDAMPDVAADRAMLDLVLRDLEARSLLKTAALGATVSENAVYAPMASDLGFQFLAFIAPPWD